MASRKLISVPLGENDTLDARETKLSLAKSIARKMAGSAEAVCIAASANIMCGRTYGRTPAHALERAKAIVYMLPNERKLLQTTAWHEYSFAAAQALGSLEEFAEKANSEGPAWLHPSAKSRKRKADDGDGSKGKDKNERDGNDDNDDDDNDEGEDLAETAEADNAEMLDANDDFSAREVL